MVTLDPSLYQEQHIDSWQDLWAVYKGIREQTDEQGRRVQWIFRGHKRADFGLQSTLERTALEWSGARKRTDPMKRATTVARINRFHLRDGVSGCPLPVIEYRLMREFRRRLHHYADVAEPTDCLEWLALMRHYGAPVRLLDWTYSFWAGVHFALVDAEGGASALWALDSDWIERQTSNSDLLPRSMRALLKNDPQVRDYATFLDICLKKNGPLFVVPVNPMRLNERLTAQKGVFLCPGDISRPFEDNLARVLRRAPTGSIRLKMITIPDRSRLRRDIRLHLDQMNISEAVLFPGLDGYARSLRQKVVDADLFQRSEATDWFQRHWARGKWPRNAADRLFKR